MYSFNSTLTSPKTKKELPNNPYVDSLHENSRSGRVMSIGLNGQDIEFDDSKLTNLYSITVNRNSSSDIELANKKYVDDSILEGRLVRFNQRPEDYFKVSVGNDNYKLVKMIEYIL